jgi:preprotein translocase subunit SecA
MTGTAETEAAEFGNTYKLSVVPIPSNQPLIRLDQPDLIYKTEEAKFAAIVEDVRERSDLGQPILLGTASVEKSELLSRELSRAGIAHEVLNAKQHFREAEIVAQAGRKHAVTVATNMAGRGVDVVLGGNYEGLATREALGRGYAPGSEEFDAAYQSALATYKGVCEAEGDEVRALGGLYVLGSERHDSRRIDNQLRGRSGRQGDPGESRFYLSLQDDLLRLFATGAVSWVMDRTMPDDLPIEAKMVSKAIERAQNTVEGKNAEIRKDTLKYDEVMNEQRKVIYGRRQQVIDGEDIHDETVVLIEEVLTNVVDDRLEGEFAEGWDLHQLVAELANYYPTTLNAEALAEYQNRDDILGLVIDEAVAQYEKKCEEYPGGMDTAKEIERDVMLQILDQRWRDHLSDMDYLRDGIHLRQIAQTDPLSAWQKEGYLMFEALLGNVDADFVRYITHVEASAIEAIEEAEADDGLEGAVTNANVVAPGATELPAHGAAKKPLPKQGDKIGRNEPCWCGSGRKFKQCHGRP